MKIASPLHSASHEGEAQNSPPDSQLPKTIPAATFSLHNIHTTVPFQTSTTASTPNTVTFDPSTSIPPPAGDALESRTVGSSSSTLGSSTVLVTRYSSMEVDSGAKVIHISDDADFRFIASNGLDEAIFGVSTTALRNFCPGLMNETGQEQALKSYTCTLTRYDPHVVRIVLNIAHGQLFRLPVTLPLATLFPLASMAEEFELVELLKPFIQLWARPLTSDALKSLNTHWLLVAWVFGFENLFKAYLGFFITNMEYYPHYGLTLEAMGGELNALLPYDYNNEIQDFVARARLKLLRKLSNLVKQFCDYNFFTKKAGCQSNVASKQLESHTCTLLRYGAFQAAITEHFSDIINSPADIADSFKSYAKALLQIDAKVIKQGSESHPRSLKVKHIAGQGDGHQNCGFDAFKASIIELFTPGESNSSFESQLFSNHFDDFKGHDENLGGMEEYFGSVLHPSHGLFHESDLPNLAELRTNVVLAKKRKLAKKCGARHVHEHENTKGEEDEADQSGLFVLANEPEQERQHVEEQLLCSDAAIVESENRPPVVAPTLGPDHEIPAMGGELELNVAEDDPFDLDYLSASDYSTEPEEEYTSDIEEILAARKLREIEVWQQASRKRTFLNLVSSEDEEPTRKIQKKRRRVEKRNTKTENGT